MLQVAPRTEGINRLPASETLSPSSQLLFSLTSHPDVLGIEVRCGLNRREEFKRGNQTLWMKQEFEIRAAQYRHLLLLVVIF